MVPVSNMRACGITCFVALILPLLTIFLLALRHRGEGMVSGWVLGALGFFIPQMAVRTPVLQLLSPALAAFSQAHPLLYSLGLAFTAALFELAGRLAVAGVMKKRLTYRRGLAAGLGHGAIEAILLVGVTYVIDLYCMNLIQSGAFDSLVAQLSQVEGVAEQMEAVRGSLITTPSWMFLLAGLERLLTMVLHVALSLLVCYSCHRGTPLRGAVICLGAHTLVDSVAGVSLVLEQTIAYGVIYGVLAVMAGLSLGTIFTIRRRWLAEGQGEVPVC